MVSSSILSALGVNGKNEKLKTKKDPLIEAIMNSKDVETVKNILDNSRVNIDNKDSQGRSALMCAAYKANVPICEFLIEKGASVNSKDDNGETALMRVVQNCSEYAERDIDESPICAVILILLEEFIRVKRESSGLYFSNRKLIVDSTINSETQNQNKEVDPITNNNNNITNNNNNITNNNNNNNNNELLKQKIKKCIERIRHTPLPERKTAIDVKDDDGVTALMKASCSGNVSVISLLVELGANDQLKDDEGWNALMWASSGLQYKAVQYFLHTRDANADYSTDKGETPLMKAVSFRIQKTNKKQLNNLINNNNNNNKENHSSNEETSSKELTSQLTSQDEEYKKCTDNDLQHLQKRSIDVCDLLIEKGAKVNAVDQEYQSPIMWAAARGNLPLIDILFKRGAKPEMQSRSGKTCLMFGAKYGHLDVCEYLIKEKRVKMNTDDDNGYTAIFHSVISGHEDVSRLLLENGSSMTSVSKRGETLLISAARNRSLSCAKLLIENNCDLDEVDENDRSAMDHAESSLDGKMVDYLRNAQRMRTALVSNEGN